jgi:hypothetical protein
LLLDWCVGIFSAGVEVTRRQMNRAATAKVYGISLKPLAAKKATGNVAQHEAHFGRAARLNNAVTYRKIVVRQKERAANDPLRA